MGDFTTYLDLYKPDGSELVDVVEQLNENYDKVDAGVLAVDLRVGAVEGIAGVVDWDNSFTPSVFTMGTSDSLVSPIWDRFNFLQLGSLVIVEFDVSYSSSLYDSGTVFAFDLPKNNVGATTGTAILEHSVNGTIPYWFCAVAGGNASCYTIKTGPPIEVDNESPFPSSTHSGQLFGAFSYRTDDV